VLIFQALELNPVDITALIARSKCYIQLAEPSKALADAEAALAPDKNNVRAIYQKAEALYYLSQFEHSLMFFHRGLRLRPELNIFRLGVQKTEKAIENIIGTTGKKKATKDTTPPPPPVSAKTRAKTAKSSSRRLLGNLYVDKEYLENLLKNPDLKKVVDPNAENKITENVKDAIDFLNSRQEFWRQQRPVTSGVKAKQVTVTTPFPKWY
jgi:tetratricopeptide repeat protein 25